MTWMNNPWIVTVAGGVFASLLANYIHDLIRGTRFLVRQPKSAEALASSTTKSPAGLDAKAPYRRNSKRWPWVDIADFIMASGFLCVIIMVEFDIVPSPEGFGGIYDWVTVTLVLFWVTVVLLRGGYRILQLVFYIGIAVYLLVEVAVKALGSGAKHNTWGAAGKSLHGQRLLGRRRSFGDVTPTG
jgi:hypothetical protein